jgi:nucleoid-associated protein YgaU
MLADNTQANPSATAPEADGIEAELAFLQDLLAQSAGEAGAIDRAELAELPWLSDELPLGAPRERYRPAGPTLVKVAAMGLATFPAAIAPVPAFANEPLPQNMMLAFAQRPESAPALGATGAQLFPFSRPMLSMRAQVAPTQAEAKSQNQKLASAKPFQLNPKLKTLFSESRQVAVTTKAGAASTFYQVGKGDSLYSIAADLLGSGGRWREIANANKATLSANYMLKPGQRLVIPTNRTVTPVHLAAGPKAQPHKTPPGASHAQGQYPVGAGDSH